MPGVGLGAQGTAPIEAGMAPACTGSVVRRETHRHSSHSCTSDEFVVHREMPRRSPGRAFHKGNASGLGQGGRVGKREVWAEGQGVGKS